MKLFCWRDLSSPRAMPGGYRHSDNAYTSFRDGSPAVPVVALRSPTLPGGVMDSTTAPAHTVEQRHPRGHPVRR